MDFDQLVTFLEVARLGSFSRAGEKVFRSQSAVSAQIRQLEIEYGDRLLDRSGKTVQLTPAGRILAQYAEQMLRLRDDSVKAVADQGVTPRGRVLIGANEATCLYVLPEVFAEYWRLYPEVNLSVYRNFTSKIVEKLEDGQLDLGVVTMPIKSQSLKVHSIFKDRLLLMVGAQSKLARKPTATLQEIAREPLIYPRTGYTRRIMDKLFRPFQGELKVRMELPSVGMIKSFVEAGLGVSLLSSSFARDEVSSGRAKLVEIEGVELWRELGLAYRRDRTQPRAVTAFIQTARKMAAGREKSVPATAAE